MRSLGKFGGLLYGNSGMCKDSAERNWEGHLGVAGLWVEDLFVSWVLWICGPAGPFC